MRRSLPSHLDEIYPRAAIDERLDALACTVDGWAREAQDNVGAPLLTVCILRGGVFFFSDLLQRLVTSVEPAFCRAWSYAKGVNGTCEENLRLDWHGTQLTGRDVLLVDNICDSGRTLAVAWTQAVEAGARSVRSITLVQRARPDAVHSPTLAGFVYEGTEWLVGYGLRDGEARTNLPSVYRIVARRE